MLHFLDVFWFRPSSHRADFVRVSVHSSILNYMAKILNASLAKFTLLPFCHELFFTLPFKYQSEVLQVLVKVLTKDEDIIKVYNHTLVQQVLERHFHQALEGGRSTGKA